MIMDVKLINPVLISPEKGSKTVVLRAGQVYDLDDAHAQNLVRKGYAERVDEDGQPEEQDVELPERPSNGAGKEVWHTYLVALEEATEDPLGALDIPPDAKRDDLIRIGDQRVTDWNALD